MTDGSADGLGKPTRKLSVSTCVRRLVAPFRIARGSRTEVELVEVELSDGKHIGRGQAAGVRYKGETAASMSSEIVNARAAIEAGAGRRDLFNLLPAGGARAAVDGALWDFEAKLSGDPVWKLAGLDEPPRPLTTAFTIVLDEPGVMREQAEREGWRGVLKVKLGANDDRDAERARAVRQGAPGARLVADGNEGLDPDSTIAVASALADLGYELFEQPLPRGEDAVLETWSAPLPLCADEALDTAADVKKVAGKYQVGNIKLDKCGGLTAGLDLADALERHGMDIFVGTMLSGAVSTYPAMILAQRARWIDLDGPHWVVGDEERAMIDDQGRLLPPPRQIWG